ncbi:MAG: hypothetical protein HYX34_05045 [Actinobacteria bacterium]|nr:hypothetical protein [Actinomycetota bacterium]
MAVALAIAVVGFFVLSVAGMLVWIRVIMSRAERAQREAGGGASPPLGR